MKDRIVLFFSIIFIFYGCQYTKKFGGEGEQYGHGRELNIQSSDFDKMINAEKNNYLERKEGFALPAPRYDPDKCDVYVIPGSALKAMDCWEH